GQRSSASPEAALTLKETQLAVLQAQNSDRHPDVVQTKAEIEALKTLIKRRSDGEGVESMSPEETDLRKDMDIADVEQRRLDTEIPSLKRKIADYQQRVAATPAHEQQFAALTRDYNVLDA